MDWVVYGVDMIKVKNGKLHWKYDGSYGAIRADNIASIELVMDDFTEPYFSGMDHGIKFIQPTSYIEIKDMGGKKKRIANINKEMEEAS